MGKLSSIGRNADFENSDVIDLKNLDYVGGSILSENSKLSVAQIMKLNKKHNLSN